MEVVEGKTFDRTTVTIDGKTFVNCTITRCVLLYAGGEFAFKGGTIKDNGIKLDGAAMNTAMFLRIFGATTAEFNKSLPDFPSETKGEH